MRCTEEEDLRTQEGVLMQMSSDKYAGARLLVTLKYQEFKVHAVSCGKPVKFLKDGSRFESRAGSCDDSESRSAQGYTHSHRQEVWASEHSLRLLTRTPWTF